MLKQVRARLINFLCVISNFLLRKNKRKSPAGIQADDYAQQKTETEDSNRDNTEKISEKNLNETDLNNDEDHSNESEDLNATLEEPSPDPELNSNPKPNFEPGIEDDKPQSRTVDIDSESLDSSATPPSITSGSDEQGNHSTETGESDESDESETNHTHIKEPEDISGRRGNSAVPQQKNSTPHEQKPLRPELVCRPDSQRRSWDVFLIAGKNSSFSKVIQNEKELPLKNDGKECCLNSLKGDLLATYRDSPSNYNIPLFDSSPLIFKSSKNWRGEGRSIKNMTKGHFVVIAPNSWERLNRPPIEAALCFDSGFKVHFFYRDKNTSDVEDGFEGKKNIGTSKGIVLSGDSIVDDSEKGILFTCEVPKLDVPHEIEWARVGEEVSGGWAKNFKPSEGETLEDVLGGREGHFFLRIFDQNGKYADGEEFRYMRNLKKIVVNDVEYNSQTVLMPQATGHSPTKVKFLSIEDTSLNPVNLNEQEISIDQSGSLQIPASPNFDRISCDFETETRKVEVVLELPRIWWQIVPDQDLLGEWRDTPYTMTRKSFKDIARKGEKLFLKSTRHESVRVKLSDESPDEYKRKKDEENIMVPLEDFMYMEEMRRESNNKICLNIEYKNGDNQTVVLIEPENFDPIVQPDTLSPSVETKDAHKVDRKNLTPRIKYVRGKRKGKGFSLKELREAGLSKRTALKQGILVDSRRRSCYSENVNLLRT